MQVGRKTPKWRCIHMPCEKRTRESLHLAIGHDFAKLAKKLHGSQLTLGPQLPKQVFANAGMRISWASRICSLADHVGDFDAVQELQSRDDGLKAFHLFRVSFLMKLWSCSMILSRYLTCGNFDQPEPKTVPRSVGNSSSCSPAKICAAFVRLTTCRGKPYSDCAERKIA